VQAFEELPSNNDIMNLSLRQQKSLNKPSGQLKLANFHPTLDNSPSYETGPQPQLKSVRSTAVPSGNGGGIILSKDKIKFLKSS
jgi:hypothetical protein